MHKLLAFLCLLPTLLSAQPSAKNTPTTTAKNTIIACRILERPANVDSFYLYETIGLGSRIMGRSILRTSDSAFVFSVPTSSTPKMYGIGASNPAVFAKVWVAEEPEITLWGNFMYLEKSRTVGSPLNRSWETVQKRVDGFRAVGEDLNFQFRQAANGGDVKGIGGQIEQHNKNKKNYLDSLKSVNSPFWKLACLHVSPDFRGDKGYEDAGDFIARESFRHANLSDVYYNDQPEIYYAFEQFARRLAMVLITSDRMQKLVDAQLVKLPEGSKIQRMAMGGIISGLKGTGHVLSAAYSTKYIDKFRLAANYGEINQMEYEISKNRSSTIGLEAPDLAGMTPDSSAYSLRQLRGKVTLIDFWASWCGPCRRENPNVVQTYNKYHAKGFDILGVSLDTDAKRWRDAIKQDGLPWHHISDLGGWQSKHAALYSVSSIPTTVLVDKEGRILARNLRGEQLGEKLKEIFGE